MGGLSLLIAVVLTLVLEGIVFLVFNYRQRLFWEVFVLINIATNILLNIAVYLLGVAFINVKSFYYIIPLEVIVVLSEWLVYSMFLGKKKHLFLVTTIANVFSVVIGVLIFGF